MIHVAWVAVAFSVGGLVGWTGGYCCGWLLGEKDTERRWSEAVGRARQQ
jgi:membrane protein DedA with SNARE-associated domain